MRKKTLMSRKILKDQMKIIVNVKNKTKSMVNSSADKLLWSLKIAKMKDFP